MDFVRNNSKEQLIDQLPVVVFEYTFFPNGHRDFTYISPRCEELLGIDPETIMHGNLSMIDFIHGDDLPLFNERVEASLRDGTEFNWEGRCKGNEGYIWVEAQGMRVPHVPWALEWLRRRPSAMRGSTRVERRPSVG